eukprot:1042853-Lingulodinium_polyedra.AAC.1
MDSFQPSFFSSGAKTLGEVIRLGSCHAYSGSPHEAAPHLHGNCLCSGSQIPNGGCSCAPLLLPAWR